MGKLGVRDSVLFDLDGTLWDASSACAAAWTRTWRELGRSDVKVTPEGARRFTGLPFTKIFDRFFPDVDPSLRATVVELYATQEAAEISERGGTLYPGVPAVLEQLSRTHRLFIVSNCLDGYIETFFRHSGLATRFEGFESAGRTGRPKAENIASVVRDYRLEAGVYVGDTAHDAEAAATAGLPFVFAAYGFGAVDSAQHRIQSIVELPALL